MPYFCGDHWFSKGLSSVASVLCPPRVPGKQVIPGYPVMWGEKQELFYLKPWVWTRLSLPASRVIFGWLCKSFGPSHFIRKVGNTVITDKVVVMIKWDTKCYAFRKELSPSQALKIHPCSHPESRLQFIGQWTEKCSWGSKENLEQMWAYTEGLRVLDLNNGPLLHPLCEKKC